MWPMPATAAGQRYTSIPAQRLLLASVLLQRLAGLDQRRWGPEVWRVFLPRHHRSGPPFSPATNQTLSTARPHRAGATPLDASSGLFGLASDEWTSTLVQSATAGRCGGGCARRRKASGPACSSAATRTPARRMAMGGVQRIQVAPLRIIEEWIDSSMGDPVGMGSPDHRLHASDVTEDRSPLSPWRWSHCPSR